MRLRLCAVVAVLWLASSAAAAPTVAPEGSSPMQEGRVVVVGDLHGDLQYTLDTLRLAGVVDASGAWAGGSTTFVQTGDIFDRGPDTRAILDLLRKLQGEAKAAGGEAIVLLGNHEVMNLMGTTLMAHPDDVSSFGGENARTFMLSAQGEYGAWLRRLPMAARVNDTVFCHAGILPNAAKHLGIDGMNDVLRRLLLPEEAAPVVAERAMRVTGSTATAALPGDPRLSHPPEDVARQLVVGQHGPLWTRWYAQRLEDDAGDGHDEVCRVLGQALSYLDAWERQLSDVDGDGGAPIPLRRMVVGHTPQESGAPTLRCGGRLVLNDVGLSRWVSGSGNVGAVEIVNGIARPITPGAAEVQAFDPTMDDTAT